eukprot:gene12590-biopygen9502
MVWFAGGIFLTKLSVHTRTGAHSAPVRVDVAGPGRRGVPGGFEACGSPNEVANDPVAGLGWFRRRTPSSGQLHMTACAFGERWDQWALPSKNGGMGCGDRAQLPADAPRGMECESDVRSKGRRQKLI